MPTAQQVIQKLRLTPHPEKGFYRQTFIDPDADPTTNRSHSTLIYYLLEEGVVSHWHRVTDAVEIWHYYAGAPLKLQLSWNDGKPVRDMIVGQDIFKGQEPQVIVEKGEWQHAQSLGEWTLVGCTVAPAYWDKGFEMAPEGWEPNGENTTS
ncbi:cupin family protein [Delitschia confertaspora ATCC 74209]|uniref:Cupin family protein n=1 Tax=Delitschia confertaspora ATCC 74209 TaxID=1513339 RepID=A0A9P4JLA1_9PLEO|nr:cupin family protein [Delitschia confertaspora ATCC 74209]